MPQYIIMAKDNITVMSPENALSYFMDIKKHNHKNRAR